MRTRVVVLTGGIGSGKSAASQAFAGLGVPIVDADQIAHALTAPQGAAMPSILASFGPDFIAADGSLDRQRMRQLVFHDPSQRSRLEAIVHPLIQAQALEALRASQAPYTLYDVPLWAEGSGQNRPDWVWKVVVVDVSPETQRQRVRARQEIAPQTLESILALQASRSARLALADEVIDNEGSEENLKAQVRAAHARWLKACEGESSPGSIRNRT